MHASEFAFSSLAQYIAYFEDIIRHILVKELGEPDGEEFALPYWDWDKHPTIPDAFSDRSSALYNATRTGKTVELNLNARRSMGTQSVVSTPIWEAMFGELDGSSSGMLEAGNHNLVHYQIGGDLGNGVTAGLDPLFWTHHCNVDRIGHSWLAAHWENVIQQSLYASIERQWLPEALEGFSDRDGNTVLPTVADALDTQNFGYRYDRLVALSGSPRICSALSSAPQITKTLENQGGRLVATIDGPLSQNNYVGSEKRNPENSLGLVGSTPGILPEDFSTVWVKVENIAIRPGQEGSISFNGQTFGRIAGFSEHMNAFILDATAALRPSDVAGLEVSLDLPSGQFKTKLIVGLA